LTFSLLSQSIERQDDPQLKPIGGAHVLHVGRQWVKLDGKWHGSQNGSFEFRTRDDGVDYKIRFTTRVWIQKFTYSIETGRRRFIRSIFVDSNRLCGVN
jgi:hypothetical protein